MQVGAMLPLWALQPTVPLMSSGHPRQIASPALQSSSPLSDLQHLPGQACQGKPTLQMPNRAQFQLPDHVCFSTICQIKPAGLRGLTVKSLGISLWAIQLISLLQTTPSDEDEQVSQSQKVLTHYQFQQRITVQGTSVPAEKKPRATEIPPWTNKAVSCSCQPLIDRTHDTDLSLVLESPWLILRMPQRRHAGVRCCVLPLEAELSQWKSS
jgi:hypothetical protein